LDKVDALREAFGRLAPRGDTFAAEWPSAYGAAIAAEKHFFEAQTAKEAAQHLASWKAAMGMLCELRSGSGVEADFPRKWFYPAWYAFALSFRIFDRLFVKKVQESEFIRPKVTKEAVNFLHPTAREQIEKLTVDKFKHAPFTRGLAVNRVTEATALTS